MNGSVRVLVVSDLHANTGSAFEVIDHAAAVGADRILQLGDFGYWPGEKFLSKVARRLELRGLTLDWIDGNHERFDKLKLLPLQPDGTQWLRDAAGDFAPTIRHLPRGFRWVWGDTTWVAAGGAVSVDRQLRTAGVNWFPAEELTAEEADAIIAAGPADVVVSHDAPLGVPLLRQVLRQDLPAWRRSDKSPWPIGMLVRSDEHQRRIRRVVEGVHAQRVFHGHHHVRYSDTLAAAHGPVAIEGLGMDLDPLSARCLLVDGDGSPIVDV